MEGGQLTDVGAGVVEEPSCGAVEDTVDLEDRKQDVYV